MNLLNTLQEILNKDNRYLFYKTTPSQEAPGNTIRCKFIPDRNSEAVSILTFDPLGAICHFKTGKVYNVNEWHYAASELNIDQDEALYMVKSSDNPGFGYYNDLADLEFRND